MKLLSILTFTSFQLLLIIIVHCSSSCHDFPAIFSFGDSNSDTGGFSASFGPLPQPYGETFFKAPAARFSDGRLIIDFIAESLGLPLISSYLDSIGANFSHGADFATALSTIVPQNVTLAQGGYSPFSLDVQLKQFLQFKSRSQMAVTKGGVFQKLIPKKNYFSEALYMIDIGQNDLTALYFLKLPRKQYLSNALQEFSTVIKSLYNNGGRYFSILNTGPLGCLPYVLVQLPAEALKLDSIGCSIVLNELAQQYNKMLNESVVQLRKELSNTVFTFVDIYSAKYTLISQAEKQGFEHPLQACCGYGGGLYNYNSSLRCGDNAKEHDKVSFVNSCKDPHKRIIWDGVHYTEAANKFDLNLQAPNVWSSLIFLENLFFWGSLYLPSLSGLKSQGQRIPIKECIEEDRKENVGKQTLQLSKLLDLDADQTLLYILFI